MKRHGDLSASVARLVAALSRGDGRRDQGCWVVDALPDSRFFPHTVAAAYERCLVKITVESRHRRRHKLELTEIGQAVARDLDSNGKGVVSTSAATLIQEILAA